WTRDGQRSFAGTGFLGLPGASPVAERAKRAPERDRSLGDGAPLGLRHHLAAAACRLLRRLLAARRWPRLELEHRAGILLASLRAGAQLERDRPPPSDDRGRHRG